MTLIRSWIMYLLAAGALVCAARTLARGSGAEAGVDFCCGLVICLALLFPLTGRVPTPQLPDLDAYGHEARSLIEKYDSGGDSALEELISSRCAEYISERARTLGFDCRAVVSCRWEDGIPVPSGAEIYCAQGYAQELADAVWNELGIPPGDQIWGGDNAETQ